MRKAAILTLGCKANQFESAAMQGELEGIGFQVGTLVHDCELVVVNTCTVTGATDTQSRKLVRRVRRVCPNARIFVTGCAAQIDPSMFSGLAGVTRVFGNMEKQDLEPLLASAGPQIQVSDIAQAEHCPTLTISGFAHHSRAFVQIQTGCNNFCTYCIIPYARGRSRSVLPSDVVAQVQTLVAVGFAEIVLTGIHIGQYGKDLNGQLDLAGLVALILQSTSAARIRLGSVEPQELTPALIDLISTSPRVCPHLHIPLQSGSNSVLQRMRRTYSADFFRDKIFAIRQVLPKAGLGFDVITGFPGESCAEFEQTKALLVALPFSYLHVFPYSSRSGTVAAQMSGQVPVGLRRARAAELREIARVKTEAFALGFVGKEVDVVFHARAAANTETATRWRGVSGEYLEVECAGVGSSNRQLHRVQVQGAVAGRALGIVVE
ncbi:MAG: tRNA (N(6)-L-threonylcarbamoyladenosine(37)-C(2))-methylthiotransferase MtaB [Desulfuromonadaceae bacterium]|nr:tRNA (N(6)-L-threonylcarbamoyladenosine(37)-C(2))-methylthiotransferase MtaB [Desulfuromonas sp.]MDY0184591.1 tRNA (N(6)-L-threonylcarbamoyladenosine(37)-C(2))-methylthiotransferase MtaB [Desulfuromonadaceae bacterium]